MMYLWLVLGFILLIKGADFFVDGASAVAKFLKVPSVVVGLTIVAMGTSAPETAVSITAGFAGNSDISLGNIVGSNIFDLLIVIGVSAVIIPVVSHKDILKRDMWWNIGVSIFLFLLLFDGTISRPDGVLLLAGMAVYLFVIIRNALKNRVTEAAGTQKPLWKSLLAIFLGLAAVIWGGNLVVSCSSQIAASLGMSDTLIGLTIVAAGTSLPELVTSISASRKGEAGIALGNAVGSCIFNILFILGAASVLTPIHAAPELIIDTALLILVSILLFILATTNSQTSRIEGILCIVCYLAYSTYIVLR